MSAHARPPSGSCHRFLGIAGGKVEGQALAYCELDRDDAARPIFDELAAKDFADFSFEPTWLYVVTNCASVCAHLGDTNKAATLWELLRPYVSHYLGMLAATLGRVEEARRHFESAAATSEHMGAPAWLARTRLEWARSLLASADTGGAAVPLLEQALDTSARLGMATVERRARALLASAGEAT